MKLSTVFLAALLAGASSAWKLGDKATGMTDSNVTKNCTLWANYISSDDTCEKLEKHFNFDFLQLVSYMNGLVIDLLILSKRTNRKSSIESRLDQGPLCPDQGLVLLCRQLSCDKQPSETRWHRCANSQESLSFVYFTSVRDCHFHCRFEHHCHCDFRCRQFCYHFGFHCHWESSATSTTTGSFPAQETDGAASFGSVNIPIVVLYFAFSTVVGSGLAIYFD